MPDARLAAPHHPGSKELALKRLYGMLQDQGWVPTPTEGLLPEQKLVQKLVQTKLTVVAPSHTVNRIHGRNIGSLLIQSSYMCVGVAVGAGVVVADLEESQELRLLAISSG